MSDLIIKDRLGIDPRQVSTRIFFAKNRLMGDIWHLCDASLGKAIPGGQVMYMALHGSYVYPAVRCDTVLQADLQRGVTDELCERCLLEFHFAVSIIREKGLLKFS